MTKKNENEPQDQPKNNRRFRDIYSLLPQNLIGGRENINSIYNNVVGTMAHIESLEKVDIDDAISELPYVINLGDLTKLFGLPEDFEGKKYTFFGAARLHARIESVGGTFRSVPIHKIFVAHLIEPPAYEKWKKMIDRHPTETYTEWFNTKDKNENFMKYEELCRNNGFEHIMHNKPTYLMDKIFKVIETTRGNIEPRLDG